MAAKILGIDTMLRKLRGTQYAEQRAADIAHRSTVAGRRGRHSQPLTFQQRLENYQNQNGGRRTTDDAGLTRAQARRLRKNMRKNGEQDVFPFSAQR
jgi:hypothetical protein